MPTPPAASNNKVTVREGAPNVLITGANRGIGLALAHEFARRGMNVIGTARAPVTAPSAPAASTASGAELGAAAADAAAAAEGDLAAVAVGVVELDLASEASIAALPGRVRAHVPHLDILINSAGVNVDDTLDSVTAEGMVATFRVNAVAPLLVTRALLPLLRASPQQRSCGHGHGQAAPKVAQISSAIASIAASRGALGAKWPGKFGYRASKAALNMVTAQLAAEVPDVAFVALHPGHVATRMSGGLGSLTPRECAQHVAQRIDELDRCGSGKFLAYDGKEIPW